MVRTDKTISQLASSLGMENTDKLYEENNKVLSRCNCHNFSIPLKETREQPKGCQKNTLKWECSNCGGEVNSDTKNWYELGLLHCQLLYKDL